MHDVGRDADSVNSRQFAASFVSHRKSILKTCWEIRQELLTTAAGAAPSRHDALAGWNLACSECTVTLDGRSCWEHCGGSPCCCAPVHVTCDFCEIYLEHRRELAGFRAAAAVTDPDLVESPAALQLVTEPQPQGGTPIMEKVQFNVPNLWADHHTLKVREVLTKQPGVTDIVASSAFRMVAMSYDPAVTNAEAISQALSAAGYPVAKEGEGVLIQPVPMQNGRRDPAWNRLGMRQFKTDERDLKTKR
jgi:copper chaperone CopZ